MYLAARILRAEPEKGMEVFQFGIKLSFISVLCLSSSLCYPWDRSFIFHRFVKAHYILYFFKSKTPLIVRRRRKYPCPVRNSAFLSPIVFILNILKSSLYTSVDRYFCHVSLLHVYRQEIKQNKFL